MANNNGARDSRDIGPHLGRPGGGPVHSASGRQFTYNGRQLARFEGPRYRWPHGYAYHRFVVGYRVPRLFLVQDYFLVDYADYGFADPPPDCQWVRYGPDVLLVDLDTGEIDQVIYGVFDDGPDLTADSQN